MTLTEKDNEKIQALFHAGNSISSIREDYYGDYDYSDIYLAIIKQWDLAPLFKTWMLPVMLTYYFPQHLEYLFFRCTGYKKD